MESTQQSELPPPVTYRERLEAFLKQFPLESGWKRTVTPISPADLIPSLGADYQNYLKQCYADSVVPRKLVAFRAELRGKDGDLYCNAHKISLVDDWTRVQACETGAMARLLGHCGFFTAEGEEADDLSALKPASSSVAATGSTAPHAKPQAAPAANPQAKVSKPEPDTVASPQASTDLPPLDFTVDAKQAAAPVVPKATETPTGAIPKPMLQQLERVSKRKGIVYVAPENLEQARAKLSELLA